MRLNEGGELFELLGANDGAQYLLRPDGYIAFRVAGYTLDERFIEEWFQAL